MNYSIIRATGPEDKREVYQFLYQIWDKEIGYEIPGTDHEKKIIHDELDSWAEHFLAIDDKKQVVGSARINILSKGTLNPSISKSLDIDKLCDLFAPEGIVFISHFAISPKHRNILLNYIIAEYIYRHLIKLNTKIALCYCPIKLVSLYSQMGLRPYFSNFMFQDRLRIPLIGCINDRSYLQKIGSPLADVIPETRNEFGETARILESHFANYEANEIPFMNASELSSKCADINKEKKKSTRNNVFQGVSDDEQDYLLRMFPKIRLARNENINLSHKENACSGVLVSGLLGVGGTSSNESDFHYFVRPGDTFGEILQFEQNNQDTNVKALETSEIALISSDYYRHIINKKGSAAIELLKNIIKIQARRATKNQLSSKVSAHTENTKIINKDNSKKPSSIFCSDNQPIESYQYRTLLDKDKEFQRLTNQAKIAQALEIDYLKKIGLKNGDHILDLGSGPGVISMILSKHFPDSHITGVEPEIELRKVAESFVKNHNIDRCDFVEGSARSIPLPDDKFDFSHARLLFQHIPDPLAALTELKRVTKPNGIVCILDVDDGTIFMHPQSSKWEAIERRVARAQSSLGGDRHVGRKLKGYLLQVGFSSIQLEIVPVTTQMLGPETFFELVFGFKRQVLERVNDWDSDAERTFQEIRQNLLKPDSIASENMFAAYAKVP